jgi:hypothetical protein
LLHVARVLSQAFAVELAHSFTSSQVLPFPV